MLLGLQNMWAQDAVKLNHTLLPNAKIVPVFTADSRAHRLTFQKNFDGNSYTAGMGGFVPFYQIENNKIKIQFTAGGSTYINLVRQTGAGMVLSTDYFGDLYADINFHNYWTIRLGTGHTSQHLSDDATIAGFPFKNYAKDYHQLMAIYQNSKYNMMVYGGVYWNYNFKTSGDISNKALIQLGFEHTPFKKNTWKHLYYAADLKVRQELDYQFTLNTQAGFKAITSQAKALRLAGNYTTGTDERGYFHPSNRNFWSMGVYLDF